MEHGEDKENLYVVVSPVLRYPDPGGVLQLPAVPQPGGVCRLPLEKSWNFLKSSHF